MLHVVIVLGADAVSHDAHISGKIQLNVRVSDKPSHMWPCMNQRPPRRRASALLWKGSPYDALQHEIAQEQASALGRLGRALEASLANLAAHDAATPEPCTEQHRAARNDLVIEAGRALWHLVVQRETLGLRDTPRLLRDYRVPDEIRDRMGIVTPAERLRR